MMLGMTQRKPNSRKTTATTALTFTRVSEALKSLRPVAGHVRSKGRAMDYLLLFHQNPSHHLVVS